MSSPESEARKTIHSIQDRLKKEQIIRHNLAPPKSIEEKRFEYYFRTDAPIARSSENIVTGKRVQKLASDAENIRNWVINHAASYFEQPSYRTEDEEGWVYVGGGFQINANNVTKPSSIPDYLLCVCEEESVHNSSVSIFFSLIEGAKENNYSLDIDYNNLRLLYRSFKKPLEGMPEEDAIVIEDLLTRVKTHLEEQTGTQFEDRP